MINRNRIRSLAASALVATAVAGAAHAGTPTPIYGGGAQNHGSLLRAWGDCAGTPITGQTLDTNCATPGVYSANEYLFAAVDAGKGLIAFLKETSPSASTTPSVSPYQDTARGFTYPYPAWHISNSDAPLQSPSPVTAGAQVIDDYQTNVLQDGFTDQQKRGYVWQYPFAVTPIDVIFNKTNFDNLQLTPASGDGEEVKLQLTKDAICFIFTKHNGAGAAVAGAYDWSNPIFSSANNKQPLLKKGETLPIVAYHRPDAAGQSYVFATFLQTYCKAYATEGYSAPATTMTWPSYILPAPQTGSSGIVKSVVALKGSVAYVGPSFAEPVLQPGTGVTTAPSAYVQSNYSASQFVVPNAAGVIAGMANAAPPVGAGNPLVWGPTLSHAFFKAQDNGAYIITGLSYLIGYQCYANAATVTGIKNLVQFYTQSPTGGTTTAEADQILLEKGFVPLSYDTKTNAAGQNFGQAIFSALTTGGRGIVAVGKTAPAVCPKYYSDTHRS